MRSAPRYCDPACRAEHWARGAAGAARAVPHAAVCAVLARFGSLKCDADMESVLRMCLDALALLRQEEEEYRAPLAPGSTPAQGSPASACAPCSPARAGARAAAGRVFDPVRGSGTGSQAGMPEAAETSVVTVSTPAPWTLGPACAPCSATGATAAWAPCAGGHAAASCGQDLTQGWESSSQADAHGAANQGPDPAQGCGVSQPADARGAASPGTDPSNGSGPCGRPALRHADLLRLCDHSADLPPRDRADWLKALRFLSHALAAEGWPHLPVLGSGLVSMPGSYGLCRGGAGANAPGNGAGTAGCGVLDPDPKAATAGIDPQTLLGLVGRICANNFGVFRACGGGRARAATAGPRPLCGAQPGLATCGPHMPKPASGLCTQQNGRGHSRGRVLGEAAAWPLAAPERAARPSEACSAPSACTPDAGECRSADALRTRAGPCESPEGGSVAGLLDDAALVASAEPCISPKGSSAAGRPGAAAPVDNGAGPRNSLTGSSVAEQPGGAAAPVAIASDVQPTAGTPQAPRTVAPRGAAAPGDGSCRAGAVREVGNARPASPAQIGRSHLAMPRHELASSAEACPGTAAASGSTHEACTAGDAAAPDGSALAALDCSLRKGVPNPVVHPAGPPHAQEVLVDRVLPEPDGVLQDPALPQAGAPHAQEVLVGRELYIAGSFINHACAPNCVLVRGRGFATVTTLRPLTVSSTACTHACMHAETVRLCCLLVQLIQ